MSKAKEYTIPAGRLWPNTPSGAPLNIEVFGATGEYQSGKTLLGLSIAPGVHPAGHPFAGQPRTLYLDHEKSGGTYGGTGCKRVDVPAEMLASGKEYTPVNVYLFMLEKCREAKPGQYDVLLIDPVTDVESGLVEYVKKNCTQYGLTPDQIKRAGGLLWGAVKDAWKADLLKIAAKFQCFYFTSHLRDVWQGNSPTGKREPKGKETLLELASLYLWLERKADEKGVVPSVPSAKVVKGRLSDTIIDDNGNLEIISLLPPRLPVCTASTIRQYIANPPDYTRLKEGERVIEEKESEAEMQRLRLATAEAERDTEISRIERLRHQAELQQANAAASAEKPQSPDQSAERQQSQEAKRKAEAARAAEEMEAMESAAHVDSEQAEIDRMKHEAAEKLAASKANEQRLMETQDTDKRMAGQAPTGDPNKATRSQINEVRELVVQLGITPDKLKAILVKTGKEKVSDLTPAQCLKLIEAFRAKVEERKQQEDEAKAKEANGGESDPPFDAS